MKKHSNGWVWIVTGIVAATFVVMAIAKGTVFAVMATPKCPVNLPVQKGGWEDPNEIAGKYLGHATVIWGEKLSFSLEYCVNDENWTATVNGYELPAGADVNDVMFTWTPDITQVGDKYLYFHLISSKGERNIVSDVGTFAVRVSDKPHEFIGVLK